MSLEGLKIRRAEADDCTAIAEMFISPKVYSGTLQVPYPSREYWRRRLTENAEHVYTLVGLIDDRVVGMVSVVTSERPRRKHVGVIAICVHGDWQGKGVGGALVSLGVS